MRQAAALVAVALAGALAACATVPVDGRQFVSASDGAKIAVECHGGGETLLIVHGGTGDRSRWAPMVPLLDPPLRVCLMDRRAHGESGDGPDYSLDREARDVAEVAATLPAPVTVLGHSFGGVVAAEAALKSGRVGSLILYEPPMQNDDRTALIARINAELAADRLERAAEIFMREIVQVSAEEFERMKARPTWPQLVASMPTAVRQDEALQAYRWESTRFASLRIPVLVLLGERSMSPTLRSSAADLASALPHGRLHVLPGQEHNAMDNARDDLARIVRGFMAGDSK